MFVGEQKDSRFQPALHQEKRLASDKRGVSIDTNSKCWTWGEMIGRISQGLNESGRAYQVV